MSRATVLWSLSAIAAAGGQAQTPRLLLQRADVSRCARSGTVDLYVQEITLGGQVFEAPTSTLRFVVDGEMASAPPLHVRAWSEMTGLLIVGVLVQRNLSMAEDLTTITSAIRRLFDSLPPSTRGALYSYDRNFHILVEYAVAARLSDEAGRLRASKEPEGALVTALESAIHAMSVLPPGRRVLVVISDGLDERPNPDRFFRAVGGQARAAGVPIAPIAFSPLDVRAPLVNLGEVAKQSFGGFRWARTADEIYTQAKNLATALPALKIVTFETHPDRCVAGRELQVARHRQVSNVLRLTPEGASEPASPRTQTPFALLAIAAGLTTAAVGLALRAIASNRRRR